MSPAFSSKSSSRLAGRLRVLPRAIANRFMHLRPRERPAAPRRILVAHHLLAGDVLMLTPLLAKLRERHADAQIVLAARRAVAPLYSGRPYGVDAQVYEPRDAATQDAFFDQPGFDLAFVPGDNRYSWLAAAANARWIVAFDGDRPAYKSWPVDELRPFPSARAAWSDMAAELAEGPPPRAYLPSDWPAPGFAPFEMPAGRYAVLHVEASTPVKYWNDAGWLFLAEFLQKNGIHPVWSAGPTGAELLRRIDPAPRFPALGHKLDLAQLWHLVAGAALLVCPDTSVMHIGRLTGTPTIALFGPSSAQLYGAGEFWREMPFRALRIADLPGRDRQLLFKREIAWPQPSVRAMGAEAVAQAALDCARHAV